MPAFLPRTDHVVVGPYVIRRATARDAAAYAQADADMVAATYAYTMPPEFAVARHREVAEVADETERLLATCLEIEARGDEPPRRTWVAMEADRIVGIVVSGAFPQTWECHVDARPLPGIRYQLHHLYTRAEAHGTGLGQAMLDVALPNGLAAYLWLIGGNDRAHSFYRRNRFVVDPTSFTSGPLWFDKPLLRLYRPSA